MKIFTVKLTKGDHRVTAEIHYTDTSWPTFIDWSGDRSAFRLRDDNTVSLLCTMDRLRETVAHQAAQAGATFTIADDGGPVAMRMDNVVGS